MLAAQVAGPKERMRIIDAICARGGEMMMHRYRCLEVATGPDERRKNVACMRGHIVNFRNQLLRMPWPPEGARLRGGVGSTAGCVGAPSGQYDDDTGEQAYVAYVE
ncbi:hypothetical protein B0H14DRAFT_3515101 [Mycena olivaceomarginata]|nr:hypothetical protein B0H14DRAFT_3515101 [Mycena olivaceomarginata]